MRYVHKAAACGRPTVVALAALAVLGSGCGNVPEGQMDDRAGRPVLGPQEIAPGNETSKTQRSDEPRDDVQPDDAYSNDIQVEQSGLAVGTYVLRSRNDETLCLDVAQAKNEDRARVQLSKCNGGKAQQWTRSGEMLQVFGDKCLNVTGGSNRNGTRLQIWTCNARDINNLWVMDGNQVQWKKNTKLCMEAANGAAKDGGDVQLWDCDGKAERTNQLWRSQGASAPATGTQPQGPSAQAPAPAPAGNAGGSKLIGPSPKGLDVAPYFWTWAQWGDYPVRTLKEGMQKVQLKSATVSFELSNGSCKVAGNFAAMGEDIKAFRKAGNRLILSFGGATDKPPYLQKACKDPTSLANVIGTQIDAYDTRNLDFDIEGDNLGDTSSNVRLIEALAELQQRYADLHVSYTLPVDAYGGLPSTAVDLIKRSIDKGVRIARVNMMTMDYGQMPPQGKSSADMVIGSVEVAVGQLKKLYPGVDAASIYHLVGITPLIGQNDPPGSGSFYFTVSDAEATARYAKEKGIGLLSYWGLMRDRSGWSSSNSNHSNTPQKDFQFLNTFRAAQ